MQKIKFGKDLEIIGHRDVRQTLCPNFDVKAWWNEREEK